MKKGLSKAVSFCMMIGLLAQSLYIPAMAEEAATEIAAESDTDTSLVGTLAFAQCEEYINIRESASCLTAASRQCRCSQNRCRRQNPCLFNCME